MDTNRSVQLVQLQLGGAFLVPFVFATLVICAAGAVLNVAVAALVIKQDNEEANRETKSSESRKANKYKAESRKQRNKKSGEAKKIGKQNSKRTE